jgi:hypothetical protein
MMTQYEVSTLLREEIPQFSGNVYPPKISLEAYASMNLFIPVNGQYRKGNLEIDDPFRIIFSLYPAGAAARLLTAWR